MCWLVVHWHSQCSPCTASWQVERCAPHTTLTSQTLSPKKASALAFQCLRGALPCRWGGMGTRHASRRMLPPSGLPLPLLLGTSSVLLSGSSSDSAGSSSMEAAEAWGGLSRERCRLAASGCGGRSGGSSGARCRQCCCRLQGCGAGARVAIAMAQPCVGTDASQGCWKRESGAAPALGVSASPAAAVWNSQIVSKRFQHASARTGGSSGPPTAGCARKARPAAQSCSAQRATTRTLQAPANTK